MPPLRFASVISASLVTAGMAAAATPKEIDAAVQKGTSYLKDQYKGAKPGQVAGGGNGIGGAALAGLALLESGTPIDDPAVKAITAGVREATFTETRTYHIALCLLYLDRLGDPGDVPLIQMLGIRLLAGQNSRGGWTYECIEAVTPADERLLRTTLMVTELKAGEGNNPPAAGNPNPKPNAPGAKPAVVGKLLPEVEKYAHKLASGRRERGDDNSNTQFAVLGVWAARKHGVPVEAALELIERRFLATQTPGGGWPYSGPIQGSPSMTCAGLLGLATALGRREERRLKAELPKQHDPFARSAPKEAPKDPAKPPMKSDDPFFNPPAIPKSEDPFFNPPKPTDPPAQSGGEPKKGAAQKKVPADARDAAVHRGLAALGAVVAGNAPAQGKGRGKGGRMLLGSGVLGERDYYFLWSVERVGVIFGLDKIGGIDWYDFGADELIPVQNADGSWGRGGRGSEVDTAFALLFLARSNLVRDLSSKVQKDASNAELRAGAGPAPTEPAPSPMPKEPTVAEPAPPVAIKPMTPVAPATPAVSVPAIDDPKTVVSELLDASDSDWEKALVKVRDAKGAAYTQGLVLAIRKLEGDRVKSARAALAERLTRMTGETLRTMAKDKDAELRRASVLAMAMKDDKTHLPDLITALLDDEEIVVRAAKAGLKSVSGQDFGPAPGANLADRTAAAKAWLEWLRKQK